MPARLRLLIPQRARREGPPGRVWSQHPGYRQHGCALETAAAVAAPFVIACNDSACGHGPNLAYPPRLGIQAVCLTVRGKAPQSQPGKRRVDKNLRLCMGGICCWDVEEGPVGGGAVYAALALS